MSSTPVLIRQATIDDLDLIVPLFDAYRQFYKFPADPELARAFLGERLRHRESVVFLALAPGEIPLGFTQLYPSFSSGMAKRIFVLNDLFVTPEARRTHVASLLLKAAAEFAREGGACRLTLSTALDNATAQALYESAGWVRDNVFCTYNLPIGPSDT